MSENQQKKSPEVIMLNIDQEVPNELIGPDKPNHLIAYNGELFNLFNRPTHSILAKSTRKIPVKQQKLDLIYKPDQVYMLDNRYHEFKIPAEAIKYVMKFFRDIYDKYRAECGVILFLNPDTKEWRVFFPIQTGNGGHLDYLLPVRKPNKKHKVKDLNIKDDKLSLYQKIWNDKEWNAIMNESASEMDKLMSEGFLNYGTIHSHCEMSAFHSGVDDDDEYEYPGIHITIGKVASNFEFACRLIAQRASWTTKITDIVNVNDEKDLSNDIDNIKVDESHFNRFIDQLTPSYTQIGFNGGYSAYKNYSNHWNGDNDWNNRRYVYGGYYDKDNKFHRYEDDSNRYADWWDKNNADNMEKPSYGKAQNLLSSNSKITNDSGDIIDPEDDPDIVCEEGEILYEKNSFRVMDKKNSRIFWITMEAFYENKEYFNMDRFEILPDPK